MNAIFTEVLPDTKSQKSRGYKFVQSDALCDCDGVICFEADKGKSSKYKLSEFPCRLGRAFRLTKPNGDNYDVLISARGQQFDTCECKGYLRHGHCLHREIVRDLIQQGRLPNPLDRGDDRGWSGELAD